MRSIENQVRCGIDPASRNRFAAGEAAAGERSRVLRHLLSGCPDCSAAVRPRIELLEPRRSEDLSMSRILARLSEFERLLTQERIEARELYTELKKHPTQRQWTLLRNSSRYGTVALAELLLDASFEAIYDDPRRALDLAEMAHYIVQKAEPGFYGDRALHDVRGRALGMVANGRRANSDLMGAEQAIAAAANELREGSGEPLAEGEHHYFAASVHRAQRRFAAARASIRRSRRIYRQIDDEHLEGRSILNEALIEELDGNLPRAIELIRQALSMVSESRDRHLALGARHNLLWCLTAAGQAAAARVELEELRPRYAELGDQMSSILLRWMEGRIALQLGRPGEAEAAFRESQEAFIDRGIPYEAATVGLDLAAMFADQGRTAELKALSADLVAVFNRLGVSREAIAALLLFERAARAEAVTATLVSRVARFLARLKKEPGLVFESGE